MRSFLLLVAVTVFCIPSYAGISVPSDGSDGAFNPTSSIEVDLSQAITGTWSDNNTANAGKGVYDPEKWAVVFKYSSVSIPSGVTVTFKNHRSSAPVVWLVQSNVTIKGAIRLDGKVVNDSVFPNDGGPGGFRGGARTGNQPTFMAGLGPGGGWYSTTTILTDATYSQLRSDTTGVVYGNPHILPLVGGSGGAGSSSHTGGGGGGAILIVCSNTITIDSGISCRGGTGYPGMAYLTGSGGAIRLVADRIVGTTASAFIDATSYKGPGRIRLEANEITYAGSIQPEASYGVPTSPPLIWPGDDIPRVAIKSVNDTVAPAYPMGSMTFPFQDVNIYTTPACTVLIDTWNVPTNWSVYVRVVPRSGQDSVVNATYVSGDASHAMWRAQFTAGFGFNVLQARAYKP